MEGILKKDKCLMSLIRSLKMMSMNELNGYGNNQNNRNKPIREI